jgi:aryl-alcohol dehydrogenase-like predicted oxidoreductase
MKFRTLGRTELQVSELALGGLFVSSYGAAFDDARLAVRRALELGINTIDTAPGYADSEEVLGRVLEDVGQPLIISTKLGGRPSPFEPQNPAHLRFSVEESLRLLKRDSVDILMIHEPDRPAQYDWWSDNENFTGPVLSVLDELKAEGAIRFIGLGGTTAYRMARLCATGRFDVVLTAFNYSLLWREAELAVLPTAREQGMGIVIGSPLQQGALAQRYDLDGAHWLSPPRRAQFEQLYALVDESGIALLEMALRFVLSNADISCVLTGARSQREVEQNVRAEEAGPLPSEIVQRIDTIAAQVPFRPFDEPAGLPFGRDHAGPGMMR